MSEVDTENPSTRVTVRESSEYTSTHSSPSRPPTPNCTSGPETGSRLLDSEALLMKATASVSISTDKTPIRSLPAAPGSVRPRLRVCRRSMLS